MLSASQKSPSAGLCGCQAVPTCCSMVKTRLWPKSSQESVTPAPAHPAPSWKAEETHELQLEREGNGTEGRGWCFGCKDNPPVTKELLRMHHCCLSQA